MTNTARREERESLLHGADHPGLRELTISLGRQDLYINLERHVTGQGGHLLFEAILTDPQGSRVIYIDREDIAECVRSSIVMEGLGEPG